MQRNRKAAFTLIELLVVIAIIAIIAAILFPAFAHVREKGWQASCLSNQKQLGVAVRMYIDDYDDRFPFVLDFSENLYLANIGDNTNAGDNGKLALPGVTGLEPRFQLVTVVTPYVKSAGVWYCPSVGPAYVWQAEVNADGWKKGATMHDQGTTYAYTYLAGPSPNPDGRRSTFMGGKRFSILQDASRWPMITDEPGGWGLAENSADPPSSVAPHSGGLNVLYGDGHAKYHHLEPTEYGINWLGVHRGDGLYPGQ